jgi:hypothetical protein
MGVERKWNVERHTRGRGSQAFPSPTPPLFITTLLQIIEITHFKKLILNDLR